MNLMGKSLFGHTWAIAAAAVQQAAAVATAWSPQSFGGLRGQFVWDELRPYQREFLRQIRRAGASRYTRSWKRTRKSALRGRRRRRRMRRARARARR